MSHDNTQATVVQTSIQGWQPAFISGGELDTLLRRKFGSDQVAQRDLRSSTLSIMSRCINPADHNAQPSTGLVVGYVQSGKTMSFTAVAAAAHDHGFRTVVIIAGSSLNLADQNKDRLAQDLDIGASPFRPWYRKHNPTRADHDHLRTALASWTRGRTGKTLLLTSLKHYKHVYNLGVVLEELGELCEPVLIIDDEADQISLNAQVTQGGESPNYKQIFALRDRVRRHTYLEYTATPQANIFIPLWDWLSPDFCEVLEPGTGYVGGKRIFVDRASDFVRVIGDDDLDRADTLAERPDSLAQALQIFFLGVASGLAIYESSRMEPKPSNRSMMVHPSHKNDSHQAFSDWVRASKASWSRQLRNRQDADYPALIHQFEQAYEDLRRTDRSGGLGSFEHLLELLPRAIDETQVREVNSRVDRTDWPREWGSAYSWILVGGQNLDRGFTVEGLTVTYMPRSIGTGQADTIQQRARFFGYKGAYEDLCRIYLGADACRAFTAYVRHERSMRDFLVRHKDRLNDPTIPREFELDPQLRPTRNQVLQHVPDRVVLRQGWLVQESPLDHVDRCRLNGQVIRAFADTQTLALDDDVPWVHDATSLRDDHRHRLVRGLSLRSFYERILAQIVLPNPEEHLRWQVALSMIVASLEEHGDLAACVVLMRPSSRPYRSVDDSGHIKQVFAGAYPGSPPYAYAGDRAVVQDDVTLQLHCFDIGIGADGDAPQVRQVTEAQVPIIALWLGDRTSRPMIRQQQSQP